MPYAPGISYRGDQYLYSALSGAGQALAQGEEKQRMLQQQDAGNDILFNTAKAAGIVTPEEEQQYLSGNIQQRNGITSALAARIQTQAQQRALAAKMQLEQAQEARLQGIAARQNALADANTGFIQNGPSDQWLGGTHLIQVAPDKWAIDPTAGGGADDEKPQPLVINGQPVAGMFYVPKTGATGFLPGTGNVMTDPSGNFYQQGSKMVPIPKATLQRIEDQKAEQQAKQQQLQQQAQAQQPGFFGGVVQGFKSQLPSWLPGVGGAVVSPAPSPTPPQLAAPAAPAAAPALQQQIAAQADQIKADYKAGKLSRDDAISQLQNLGFE